MNWPPDNSALEAAVQVGKSAGADGVELYCERSQDREVKVYRQNVESLTTSESVGVGARVIVDGKAGYSYSPDLADLDDVVIRATANAAAGTSDEFNTLPRGMAAEPIAGIFNPALEAATAEERIELAMKTEAAAEAHDSRVKGYTTAYADGIQDIIIYSSEGVSQAYKAGSAYIYTSVAAEEDGQAQTGWSFQTSRNPAELDPIKVGVEAASRAVALLGAKKIPSQKASIILQPMVASQIIGLLGSVLTGDAIQKNRSLFVGKVGEVVASPLFHLVDDGRHPDGLNTAPVDDEGVPTGKVELISGGVLKGYLHDHYTGQKAGAESTGNATRGSYRTLPGVSARNLVVEPGDLSPEQLIQKLDRGLIVYEVSGLHAGANPISGEVSLGATGLWVEDGKVVHPVREITIGSTIPEMLKNVEALGNDFQFVPMGGSVGTPSIMISGMTVGGE